MTDDNQFRNLDVARWPQQVRVEYEREECDDHDSTPESSGDPEYADEEKERADDWRAGGWRFIGIRCKATVFVPIGASSFTAYTLHSAGLWGLESDSDAEYLASVYAEEKDALRSAMVAMGAALNTESLSGQAIEIDA